MITARHGEDHGEDHGVVDIQAARITAACRQGRGTRTHPDQGTRTHKSTSRAEHVSGPGPTRRRPQQPHRHVWLAVPSSPAIPKNRKTPRAGQRGRPPPSAEARRQRAIRGSQVTWHQQGLTGACGVGTKACSCLRQAKVNTIGRALTGGAFRRRWRSSTGPALLDALVRKSAIREIFPR